MIARLNYSEDYYRSETNREDLPRGLPQSRLPAFDTPSQPAIDGADPAPQTPWRHPRLTCPLCTSHQVNCIGRRGLWDYLLSVIYLYPFKCVACNHRFRGYEWGVRYHRKRNY